MKFASAALNLFLAVLAFFLVLLGFKLYHDFFELRDHLREEWTDNEIWYKQECVGTKEKMLPHEPEAIARHRLEECDKVRHGLTMSHETRAFYEIANSTLSWCGETARENLMGFVKGAKNPVHLFLLIVGILTLVVWAFATKRLLSELWPALTYKIPEGLPHFSLNPLKKKSE